METAAAQKDPKHDLSMWRLVVPNAQPIVVINDGEKEHHLYCIHSVTGDVGGLRTFASHFGSVRLHGIQMPKKEMLQHLSSNIETIAAHHVALLEAYQPQGKIHLIGWSAGAIVALEMAQQLCARGREVPLVVALDGAPCNTGAGLRPGPRYLLKMIANLPRWIRDDRRSDWSFDGIRRRLSEKLTATYGAGALRSVDTLDKGAVENVISRPGWSPEQKGFVYNIYKASECYVPKRYYGSVVVFEMRTQPLFRLRQIGAAWRAISEAPEIVRVTGNHSSLIKEPVASFLAAEIVRRFSTLEITGVEPAQERAAGACARRPNAQQLKATSSRFEGHRLGRTCG